MRRFNVAQTSLAFTLFLMLLMAGCTVEPEPFDSRRAGFEVEIYTTVQLPMETLFDADSAFVSASYASGWAPDDGAIPAVPVPIPGCTIKVNGAAMQSNPNDEGPEGYRIYRESEALRLMFGDGAPVSNLAPVTLAIELPSQDNYHYPDGYPTLETTIAFPEFQFLDLNTNVPVAEGDTIHYTWTRSFEVNPSWSWFNDPDRGRLIRIYHAGGAEVRRDTLAVDARVNELEVVVGEYGSGQPNRSIELRLQLTTSYTSTMETVVPGKQAFIGLREIREYKRTFAIQ